MAEWLRTGLQIRLRRFDSGSGLQNLLRSPPLTTGQTPEILAIPTLCQPLATADNRGLPQLKGGFLGGLWKGGLRSGPQ
jgi:hypothetical protein